MNEILDTRVYVTISSLMKVREKALKPFFPANRSLKSILLGRFGSKTKGRGLMFEEIRPYHIGDDVRNMDWKVTSRLRAPHIRTYLEEKTVLYIYL